MKTAILIIAIMLTMIEAAWADPPVQQQYAIVYFGTNVFLHDDTNTPLHERVAEEWSEHPAYQGVDLGSNYATNVTHIFSTNGGTASIQLTGGYLQLHSTEGIYVDDYGTEFNLSPDTGLLTLSVGLVLTEPAGINMGNSLITNWNAWSRFAPTQTVNWAQQTITNISGIQGASGSANIDIDANTFTFAGSLLVDNVGSEFYLDRETGILSLGVGQYFGENATIDFYGGAYIDGDDPSVVSVGPAFKSDGPATIVGLTTCQSNIATAAQTIGLVDGVQGVHAKTNNSLYMTTANLSDGGCGHIVLKAGYGLNGGQSGHIYLEPGVEGAGTPGSIIVVGDLDMNEWPITNASIIVFFQDPLTSAIYPDGTNLMFRATNGVVGTIQMTY